MANYEFTATPTLTDGAVSWQLCVVKPSSQAACGDGSQQHPYPDVTVPPGQGTPTFQYKITNDNTGLNIAFQQPPASSNIGPIWVQATTKPTGPVLDAQIQSPNGAGSGHTVLTFADQNSNTGTLVLNYQLNFVDQHGNAVTPIDPDITNGGHGVYSAASLLIAAAVVAALVSAVVTLVLAPMVARRAVKP
jgi:hypothetical protein